MHLSKEQNHTVLSRILILSLLNLLPLSMPSGAAGENQQEPGKKDQVQDTTKKAQDSKSPLSGQIKAIDVEAAECLRQMGDCLKKMERAALELMGEATRQDYISVGDPDVIGTMIIPAIPSPSGMLAVGPYLPIRDKFMDYYLDQIGKLIPIYAEYTDSLVMPPQLKERANSTLKQMLPQFEDAKARYMELLALRKDTKTPHNEKIAALSVQIHDDMQSMDKLRKEVFALLKENEKASK